MLKSADLYNAAKNKIKIYNFVLFSMRWLLIYFKDTRNMLYVCPKDVVIED